MYELEINGRKFNYYLSNYSDEFGIYDETTFYKTMLVEEKVWSWRKFRFVSTGKMVEEKQTLFVLPIDIHNPNHTKKEVRERLEREIELLNRAEEIERGEII